MASQVRLTVHMLTSLDGKTTGAFVEAPRSAAHIAEYYRIDNEHFKPVTQVCLCGSKTVESMAALEAPENLPSGQELHSDRSDFHADLEANPAPPGNHYFAVVDPRGRLPWKRNTLHSDDFTFYNGDRVVEVLVEDWVTDNFLAQLRKVNVPYIFAGKSALDCRLAVDKLGALFKTDRVVCHGGGTINGALLAQGAVDELSLVMVPEICGDPAGVPLFKSMDGGKLPVTDLDLGSVEKLPEGALWLRYSKKSS